MIPDTGQMTSAAVYWSHVFSAQGRRNLQAMQGVMGITLRSKVNEQVLVGSRHYI